MEGGLFWITGLSGAGKTTIGTLLYRQIKQIYPNTVLFDGDALRHAFGNDLGYSREDRFVCAMRYSRLCRLLVEQGIYVICCTISMFDQVRDWNRANIPQYAEIYVKVPTKILAVRNQKNLYHDAAGRTAGDMVGIDLEPELPQNADIILINDGTKSPEEQVQLICEWLANTSKMKGMREGQHDSILPKKVIE